MSKINKAMSEEELENIKGGLKLNLDSAGAKYVMDLIKDPQLGPYIVDDLLGTNDGKIIDVMPPEQMQASIKMSELMKLYPDLFE